ncbi:potassium-transporting ATPase subunit KdpC [Galactobacter valiniphilus]|uniref:potassium-transporting ATPase subunit KdpC n=1 Tax=Galactobacter valiniphilus TaxID=2676122 RepID=UPI00373641EA
MSPATGRSPFGPLSTALRLLLIMTVLLGVVYPLAMVGVGRLVAPAQAAGSLVLDGSGQVVGSALIDQAYLLPDGSPDPRYFQSRPSAAGDGYDAMSSGGSNLGPINPELVEAIRERRAAVAAFEGVAPGLVPADAVTASASGLDPDISPAYAALQVARVARERGLAEGEVRALVEAATERPWVVLPGQARVNVLRLNATLEAAR